MQIAAIGFPQARAIESRKPLNFGFQFYDTPRLYEKNLVVTTLPVWKGTASTLKAGFTDDLHMSLPKGLGPKLKVAMEARQSLTTPVAPGQPVGARCFRPASPRPDRAPRHGDRGEVSEGRDPA